MRSARVGAVAKGARVTQGVEGLSFYLNAHSLGHRGLSGKCYRGRAIGAGHDQCWRQFLVERIREAWRATVSPHVTAMLRCQAASNHLCARRRPAVGCVHGFSPAFKVSIHSSTIWQSSAQTCASSAPWQQGPMMPGHRPRGTGPRPTARRACRGVRCHRLASSMGFADEPRGSEGCCAARPP